MTSPHQIRQLTDAELERLASHDRIAPEVRQALVEEQHWRAIAAEEALRYPTFEAYDKAMRDEIGRRFQGSGERLCGTAWRSVSVARKAFYEKTWAGRR